MKKTTLAIAFTFSPAIFFVSSPLHVLNAKAVGAGDIPKMCAQNIKVKSSEKVPALLRDQFTQEQWDNTWRSETWVAEQNAKCVEQGVAKLKECSSIYWDGRNTSYQNPLPIWTCNK